MIQIYTLIQQKCIPVGCVPSAAVAVCWGGVYASCILGYPPGRQPPWAECVCPRRSVSAEGGLPGGGGSAQEGCLLGGIPVCTEADTPPPCGQNSSHTFVKILHCHNFVADGNNEKIYQYLFICI